MSNYTLEPWVDDHDDDLKLEFFLWDNNNVMMEDTIDTFNLSKRGNPCKLIIYPNEGPKPHFHVVANDFNSCVRLDVAEYFLHGIYTDTINSRQLKALIKRLKDVDDPLFGLSVWEILVVFWNKTHPKNRIKTRKMPDYKRLNDSI